MTRLLWFLIIPREDNVREKLAAERKEKEAYAKKVGQLTMQVVLIVFTGDKMDESAKLHALSYKSRIVWKSSLDWKLKANFFVVKTWKNIYPVVENYLRKQYLMESVFRKGGYLKMNILRINCIIEVRE